MCRIEYRKLFAHDLIVVSVYIILQLVFSIAAIFISHYAYRHFKNLGGGAMGMGGGFMPNQPGDAEQAQQYRRMPDEDANNNARNRTPTPNNNDGNVFRGQGVRIG